MDHVSSVLALSTMVMRVEQGNQRSRNPSSAVMLATNWAASLYTGTAMSTSTVVVRAVGAGTLTKGSTLMTPVWEGNLPFP